jgi:hypothetical protein
VQGRQALDGVKVGEHVVVDVYGLGRPWAAVDDAVPDRLEVVDLLEEVADRFQVVHALPPLHRAGGHLMFVVDRGQLQAARPGAGHEHLPRLSLRAC